MENGGWMWFVPWAIQALAVVSDFAMDNVNCRGWLLKSAFRETTGRVFPSVVGTASVRIRQLFDCYWGGSLDFNFLGCPHVDSYSCV